METSCGTRSGVTELKIGTSHTITLAYQPPLIDSTLGASVAAAGAILTVGSGKDYATIADAVAHAQSGDTIEVQAGTYQDDFLTIRTSLTLQAVGGVVKMVETHSPPNGKAMIVEGGSGVDVTINGFNIGGVQVSAGNGAAIRYEGGSLTLNDDYFHNNQDGILAAADPSGAITINHSEFAYNGVGDGQTHNIYVNDVGTLTITNSYIHDANRGHEVKSRAENTIITGTRIFDNNSRSSYSIDLPNGGNATIRNDTIQQGPNVDNDTIIRYGEEGSLHAGTSVQIDSNTIVNDHTHGVTVVGNATTTPLTFDNNQLYGITPQQIGGPVNASNTTYLTTEPTLDTTPIQTVCFAEGTRILTAHGEVAVEHLTEGAPLVTHTGAHRPLKWLGHRRLDLTRHPRPDLVAPVCILRDALAPGQPHRDLRVSPDHGLFVEGRLIPAKLLINDMTIRQERAARAVCYYHVELDRHAILLAQGLPAESYLDTGNRAFFANAGQALMLHPEFQVNAGLRQWATDACAPLMVSPAAVEPVWHRLAARAEAMGYQRPRPAITHDPALRAVVRGRSLRPSVAAGGRFAFTLPAGAGPVRLTSRAIVPSHAEAWRDEWRRLGVAVRRIVLHGPSEVVTLAPDDPALAEGWHAVERDTATMWRWTNGDAVVQLPACDAPVVLEVEVGISLAYFAEDELPDAVARAA